MWPYWWWQGRWPGRGPFSYLPPWQRPGWLFGRGACWWLFGPWTTWYPQVPPAPVTQLDEKTILENRLRWLEEEIRAVRKRLEELGAGSA